MKKLKKAITFIVSISMLATFSACNSDNKDSSKEETTTEIVTEETAVKIDFELDETFAVGDIIIPVSSQWEKSDQSDLGTSSESIFTFNCPDDSGFLMITLSQFETNAIAENMLETRIKANDEKTTLSVSDTEINVLERYSDNEQWKNYLFVVDENLYDISFSVEQNELDSCFMYTHSDEIIKDIQFNNIENSTQESTDNSSELSETQKLIVDILQSGFESSFGENMKVYYEEDKSNYVISIWQDGVAANLENEAAADAWSTMIDTLVSAVGQMTDPIRQIDSTANVTLNILNDENQKDILLTIYNDEVSYNIIDSETKPKEKTSEKSNKAVEHRTGDEIIGISDKSITDDDIYVLFEDSVRNDTTGKWRLARFSESIDISEYALSYYKEYFKSDDEIHAVINFATKTTTNISCMNGLLFVTTYEYVDKEEHDANKLFSGQMLSSYIIYLDNGDIEKI